MRDSCGKKGFFSKDLPCPYDGPPLEVCGHSLLPPEGIQIIPNSQQTTRLARFWSTLVARNMPKVPSAVQQDKSNPCATISTKLKVLFHPAQHAATTSVHSFVLLLALHNREHSLMLPLLRRHRQDKRPSNQLTFTLLSNMDEASSTVVRMYKWAIPMVMPWI